MADMANTATVSASPEVSAAHDAAVAFSKAAGDKMKSADLAVTAAKGAYVAAVKVQVAAHAEATAANVVLEAADAAMHGVSPSHKWYYVAAAVAVIAIAAAGVVHFVL